MSRAIRAVLLTGAALVFVLACAGFRDSVIDDAFIVFRYADHLLAGHGPVFNPGERVEGFTSPLWLLLLAAGRAAGFDYLSLVPAFGVAFGLAAIAATHALARRVAPGWPALLAPALLALHPGFAMWSVHGLETSLFLALLAAGLSAWVGGSPRAAGGWLGAAFWTRPEAAMVVVVLAALAFARRERRRSWEVLSVFAACAVPLLAARLLYYGALFPNTFHAKTGGGFGRILFGLGSARLFVETHLPLVFAAGAAALASARRRSADPAAFDLAVLGAVWSAWIVWIGGDAFPGYRFWLPVLPIASAVAAWGIARASTARWRGLVLAAGSVVGIGLVAYDARPDVLLEYETGKDFTAKMRTVGRWMKANVPPGTVIAVNYVGALPWESGLPTIDMLGLTDAAVGRSPIAGRFRFPGHAKGNGASILERRPGLILMGGVYLAPDPPGGAIGTELDSEDQIAADPRLAAEYVLEATRIAAPGGRLWFAFYKRRDLAWSPPE
ncbi:MAG TPA: hypothetical protein VF139_01805 [Candidatus Polarisedimenticolaceae bacterium]